MQLLRSVVFTTCLFIGTLLYAVAVVALSWLPSHKLYGVARSWGRTHLWLLKTLCGLSHIVDGRENIPPGAHVSMWKHSSAWETIAQAAIFPPQSWVLKRELMWIPLRRLGRALPETDRDRSQGGRRRRVAGRRAGNAAAARRDCGS